MRRSCQCASGWHRHDPDGIRAGNRFDPSQRCKEAAGTRVGQKSSIKISGRRGEGGERVSRRKEIPRPTSDGNIVAPIGIPVA